VFKRHDLIITLRKCWHCILCDETNPFSMQDSKMVTFCC